MAGVVSNAMESTPWSQWCRLCAMDTASHPLSAASGLVDKYLAISLQQQQKAELPENICRSCFDTLNFFDSYSSQCERVQSMFQLLLNEPPQFDDTNDCTVFRRNYLQCIQIEDKFLPICTIKAEEDDLNIDAEDNLKNENKDCRDFDVKDESDGDDVGGNDNSCSEDDYVPLSTISNNLDNSHVTLKRKAKKIKHSPKSKRKKLTKTKHRLDVLEEILVNEDVDIKTEPFSDDEQIGSKSDAKAEGTKKKKERSKKIDTILNFNCYICKQECKNWHALCLHFRDCHDTRAKVECCCGKLLGSRVSIGRHSASHGRSESFDCTKCSKRFPRLSELQSHMISHLPKEEYPYVCCKCARRFTTPQLLKHHEKKHIPMEERLTHPCKICKSKFASKSSLLMHIKSVHERLKPFVCDQCGKAFTTKGILEEHQVRHSDDRPHVCPVCHKSFKTKQRLAIHSDTHKDTVYQCPHCPMQLNSRRTLRMHLFVHDDILRYQCNLCEKAFRRAKDLKNHNNLHTGRRPYSCPWCSRTFANGSNCRAHKRRMHPNELRVYDAAEAMRNKVQVPMEDTSQTEDRKESESLTPKIIYVTVKRKPVQQLEISPNFTFPPDVTEKEHLDKDEKPPVAPNDPSTKQEKSSPVHTYESSLSPLNLNTSKSNMKMPPCLPMTDIPVYNPNGPYGEQNGSVSGLYPKLEYEDVQNQVFSKTQLYTGFNNPNLQSVYDATAVINAASYSTANPYGVPYNRDDN